MRTGPTQRSLKPTLAFLGDDGARVGDDRFALLAAIDQYGSISDAAKAVGLSYRGAWDAVNVLNNLFPRPLVIKHPGGKNGGGAIVTDEGRRTLAVHRHLSDTLAQVLNDLNSAMDVSPSFWSFSMKTSARNTYHGVISAVTNGPINCEVTLKISDATSLTVVITNKSTQSLGLAPGREAFALIKASTPILMADCVGSRTSARNRICGEVASVDKGSVSADVVLDIGEGKTLSAIVTHDSIETMNVKPGDRLCALIKASQIILGVD